MDRKIKRPFLTLASVDTRDAPTQHATMQCDTALPSILLPLLWSVLRTLQDQMLKVPILRVCCRACWVGFPITLAHQDTPFLDPS